MRGQQAREIVCNDQGWRETSIKLLVDCNSATDVARTLKMRGLAPQQIGIAGQRREPLIDHRAGRRLVTSGRFEAGQLQPDRLRIRCLIQYAAQFRTGGRKIADSRISQRQCVAELQVVGIFRHEFLGKAQRFITLSRGQSRSYQSQLCDLPLLTLLLGKVRQKAQGFGKNPPCVRAARAQAHWRAAAPLGFRSSWAYRSPGVRGAGHRGADTLRPEHSGRVHHGVRDGVLRPVQSRPVRVCRPAAAHRQNARYIPGHCWTPPRPKTGSSASGHSGRHADRPAPSGSVHQDPGVIDQGQAARTWSPHRCRLPESTSWPASWAHRPRWDPGPEPLQPACARPLRCPATGSSGTGPVWHSASRPLSGWSALRTTAVPSRRPPRPPDHCRDWMWILASSRILIWLLTSSRDWMWILASSRKWVRILASSRILIWILTSSRDWMWILASSRILIWLLTSSRDWMWILASSRILIWLLTSSRDWMWILASSRILIWILTSSRDWMWILASSRKWMRILASSRILIWILTSSRDWMWILASSRILIWLLTSSRDWMWILASSRILIWLLTSSRDWMWILASSRILIWLLTSSRDWMWILASSRILIWLLTSSRDWMWILASSRILIWLLTSSRDWMWILASSRILIWLLTSSRDWMWILASSRILIWLLTSSRDWMWILASSRKWVRILAYLVQASVDVYSILAHLSHSRYRTSLLLGQITVQRKSLLGIGISASSITPSSL